MNKEIISHWAFAAFQMNRTYQKGSSSFQQILDNNEADYSKFYP